MFGVMKNAALGIGMGALLAGCAAAGGSAAAPKLAAARVTPAVACSKCEVKPVKVATTDARGRVTGYTIHSHMDWPDCKTPVQNFFAAGVMQHACARCDASGEACDAHT